MSDSNQSSACVSRTGRFGLVTISVRAETGLAVRPVQARVVAQDRWLVMDPETPVFDSSQGTADPGFADVVAADRKPGEVVLRRDSQPLRLWAIVHDLNRQPTSCEPWIAAALMNIFRELTRRRTASVSLPCFGLAEGIVDNTAFLNMLAAAIGNTPVVHRISIDLDCTKSERAAMCDALLKLEF